MTVASNQAGTQSATINTEHTLGSAITAAGVYVLVVDFGNHVNGDSTELRIYTKAKSGGTERLAYYGCYAHAQAELIKYSVAVPSDTSFKATLKQTGGAGRSFDWNILAL
jgi:hypothetical protein